MEIKETHIVYLPVRAEDDTIVLEEYIFNDNRENSFSTELEAIQALVYEENTGEDFLILKSVHIG